MKHISASLPSLGMFNLTFHDESETLLELMGTKELERLDCTDHLGTAAHVFTGVNHSRLEYALLQCAVISLLRKFHKDNDQFALSGKVTLVGHKKHISSGEELLKCWAFLGNFGHTYLTYGVERPLMQHAAKSRVLQNIFIDKSLPKQVKNWCKEVIMEHQEVNFHYVFSFYRICQLPPRSRDKSLFINILRNLVIPLEELEFKDFTQRAKLYRLRKAYEHIRLLCLVSLDAYYSHQPMRFQLSTTVISIDEFVTNTRESEYLSLLRSNASWLADELYLHPSALAVLRQYEIDAHNKLQGKYKRYLEDKEKFGELFKNLLHTGFGKPRVGELIPLLRLSFLAEEFEKYREVNLNSTRFVLQKKLSGGTAVKLSVMENPYSKVVHVDFFHKPRVCTPQDLSNLYWRIYNWLAKALETEFEQWLGKLGGLEEEQKQVILETFKPYYFKEKVEKYEHLLNELFWGVMKYTLPNNLHVSVEEFIQTPRNRLPILANFEYQSGDRYEGLSTHVNEIIESNPNGLSDDRLQELRALMFVVNQSKAPLTLGCIGKSVVKDNFNRPLDDWDGVVIEVHSESISVLIIEAKNGRQGKKREDDAFRQLLETKKIILSKRKLKYKRERIAGLGASIRFDFST